jgi:tetratricopeptide (TPR) repeat protein
VAAGQTAPQAKDGAAVTTKPADLLAPFPVPSQLQFGPQEEFLSGGLRVLGGPSAPVNTEAADRAFFTAPEFAHGENSGRLFDVIFTLHDPNDPDRPWQYLVYLYWKPANAEGGLAQLLYTRPGLDPQEVTTDGKALFVHHALATGSRVAARVDRYLWKGDALGHGRFVLQGTPPRLNLPAPRTPAEDHLDAGYAALKARQADEALAEFDRSVAVKPNAAAYLAMGDAYDQKGISPKSELSRLAIKAYGHAIALEPKRADAYLRRGYLYQFDGRYEDAIHDFTRLIALRPERLEGYLRRAEAHAERGDFARATADAGVGAHRHPEEEEAWTALCRYQYRLGKDLEAQASAAKAVDLDPMANDARLVVAFIYARSGKQAQALQQVQGAEDNGLSTEQRETGLAEVARLLQKQPGSKALQALEKRLKGPDS